MRENHDLFQKTTALLPNLWRDFIEFEQRILELAQAMQVNLSDYQIDHLAVRVNLCKEAEVWLTALLKCGRILSDNQVNGRVIYLIELNRPLIFAGQPVTIIELPFPKNKIYPKDGFEHIEIVVPFEKVEAVSAWENRILRKFAWDKYSDFVVKVDEPKVEGEQLPNPSIAVSLADKTLNHTCIKVHPYHIKQIIEV